MASKDKTVCVQVQKISVISNVYGNPTDYSKDLGLCERFWRGNLNRNFVANGVTLSLSFTQLCTFTHNGFMSCPDRFLYSQFNFLEL